ncbi:NEL-type E3 ubiquitin ligase domain-containing protein [Pseudomonas huanghezhanensis]|uniref:NEL-type E3 ubiquitin ligase domain-containing protein n=1 Tax=Pseudomonas huanghezhanensis TaxID=3002903 RepID=UPI002E1C751A
MSSIPTVPPIMSPLSTAMYDQVRQRFMHDPVLKVIHNHLPAAFVEASSQARKDYCASLLRSRLAREELKQVFKPLKGIAEFAEPLLSEALRAKFGPGLDVTNDTLFNPTLTADGATGPFTQLTLLESALHNFERKETVAGGFLKSAAILDKQGDVHPVGITPEQFADVCRHLNLGLKYFDHLRETLEPDTAPGDTSDVARFNTRAKFIAADKAEMELSVRAAMIKKTLGETAGHALLALAQQQPKPLFDGKPILLQRLTIFGVEIQRALLISPTRTWTTTPVPLVLYIPHDPVSPIKEFGSMTELEDDLRQRLTDKSYQAFFAQLIGERLRAQVFNRLNKHLFPLMPDDAKLFSKGLWHHRADPKANLVLDCDPIRESLFSRMHRQQLFLLKDNAQFLAVPTEVEDAKSRQERLAYWMNIGMNILNVASFAVPALGALMMLESTVELVGEVYYGLLDLSHGDLQEGLEHLLSVTEQLAFMALLVAGHQIPEPPQILSNHFVGQLIPIKLNTGETRLWKPDLTPFQSTHALPVGATADINGVVEHDGKKYLDIDDRRYEVQHDPDRNKWVVRHPRDNHPFSPVLEHNGAGAFRHEGELPQQWAKNKLFKRLGHSVAGLSESSAEQILGVADVDESLLRQVHVQNAVAPGQLRDTVKRFQLDAALESASTERLTTSRAEQFNQEYVASERSEDPGVQLIQRDFPTVPEAVAEDLLTTLTPSEKQQMLDSGRIPLRVGEAAAWQQRQTRLNRAFEGFFLNAVSSPDTEILSLHWLEKLPGWSEHVRLEVRQHTYRGTLLQSIGRPNATKLKVLVKSNGQYQAFDAEGNELNGVPREGNNLCASILHALPDDPRRALGFPNASQSAELNTALAKQAMGDRAQSSRILGISNATLTFNTPERLKWGRLGYPLSGVGRLPDFVSDDHLLDRISLLELQDVSAMDVLTSLRAQGLSNPDINARLDVLQDEYQALRASIDQWALASSALQELNVIRAAGRARIAEAILRHWQASSLLVLEETATVLRLENVALVDFPEPLPAFFYRRVNSLQLHDTFRTLHSNPRLTWDRVEQVLDGFLSRFAHITSLEVGRTASAGYRSPGYFELPRIAAIRLPRLRTLNMINQDLIITPITLAPLNGLEDLERLDVSGSQLQGFSDATQFPIQRRLQRLGLDRTGISWPAWLNDRLPGGIGELSLNDNRISALPERLVSNGIGTPARTHISLRGNQLPRSVLIEMQLDEARPDSAVSFDCEPAPELQARIDVLLGEQAELQNALRDWSEAPGSTESVDESRAQARRETSELLLTHWGRAVSGRAPLAVAVEASPLTVFPHTLPDSFYRNVSSLSLSEVGVEPLQLEEFLRRFGQVSSLELAELSPALVVPPQVLTELGNLRELDITNQGMTLDQSAMDFYARLPRLEHLNVSGNRLGIISDTTLLAARSLRSLTLDNVGMTSWPEWLSELLPAHINSLSLNRNQLTALPAEIMENPRNELAHTEISLEGNPLSRESMIAMHVRDHGNNTSFSFYMDLPEDIRAMPVERREGDSFDTDSDSDLEYSPDSPVHGHGRVGVSSRRPLVDPWLTGTADELFSRRGIWERLETAADAPQLMALVDRLRESADFLRARATLTPRVWHVLEAAEQDPELRALLNGMAQDEDIGNPTCADGVRLEFNQMEVQVFTRRSLLNVADGERGPTLYELMRRLFRLSEVDRLAVANTRGRDQAEVRLAYRLGLAERLDLPLAPSSMLYRTIAGVTSEELAGVQGEVMAGQNGPGLLDYAANRDFWTDWLRETYASQFEELQATFDQQRSRLEDDFPELNDQYLEQAKRLLDQKQEKDLDLIRRLTHRAGLGHD